MKKLVAVALIALWCAPALAASPEQSLLESRLAAANQAYEAVRDYTSRFSKSEASDGKLGETEEIFLKFEKPFKIFLGWTGSRKKGLQVAYERGQHGNKLAIHQPGLLFGFAQVVFLDQSSPWVREGSASFDIEDAGIGTFLSGFSRMVASGTKENKISVKEADGIFDVRFPGTAKDAVYFASRIEVKFDPKTSLPVWMTLYDWDNAPIGIYSYENLKLNVGSDDAEFKKIINRRLYRVYSHKS